MGDTLFGIQGQGFAILAADSQAAYSIINMKSNEDKICLIDGSLLLACGGPCADRTVFTEYIDKNIALYRLRNGVTLDTAEAAFFTRRQLATALRKDPKQCDMLMAGYDEAKGDASLYYIDNTSTLMKLSRGAHGYGSYFCNGLLDKLWHPKLTEAEARAAIKACIKELETRLVLKLPNFIIKIVDQNGVRVIPQSEL